jgi:hypothetical protein
MNILFVFWFVHVKWVPYHHFMAHHQVVDRGDERYISRLTTNTCCNISVDSKTFLNLRNWQRFTFSDSA